MGVVESVTVNVWLVVLSVPASGVPLIVPDDTTLNCNPLAATGGIQPYTWSVNPALPNEIGRAHV